MNNSIETYISKYLDLIEVERCEEVNESNALRSKYSEKQLEKDGFCIRHLIVDDIHSGLYGRTLVTFIRKNQSTDLPSSKISNRDIISISSKSNSSTSDTLITGIVYRMTTSKILVALNEEHSDDFDASNNQERFTITLLANEVTYSRMKFALNKLLKPSLNCKEMISVCFGQSEPSMKRQSIEWTPYNKYLNTSQYEAIDFALNSEQIALIHGPPGTGKTTTIAEFIRQCVKLGQKVLCCAPSNIAVDNIILKLADIPNNKVRITRLGHPARLLPSSLDYSLESKLQNNEQSELVRDIKKEIDQALRTLAKLTRGKYSQRKEIKHNVYLLRKELKDREKRAIKDVMRNSDIILSTNVGAADRMLSNEVFDTVIIDECAQSVEASCWIAASKGKRLILAGDHLQLPPTVKSQKAQDLSITLFDRLTKLYDLNRIGRMLKIQYRMNEKIMKWCSNALYNNELIAHESVKTHVLADLEHVNNNRTTRESMVLIDTIGCNFEEDLTEEGESRSNRHECTLVANYVDKLLSWGLTTNEIAVITPYRAQVNMLREVINAKIEIGTVDGFQGREKEAIIISFVRSNSKREVGFLSEDRRTNVSITRAKRHVCCILDSGTVSSNPFLKDLIDYMQTNGDYRSAMNPDMDDDDDDDYDDGNENIKDNIKDNTSAVINTSGNAILLSQNAESKQNDHHRRMSKRERRLMKRKEEQSKKKNNSKKELKENNDKLTHDNLTEEEIKDILYEIIKKKTKYYKFTNTLNSYERMLIHQICDNENLPLLHNSEGEGKERSIVIRFIEKNVNSVKPTNIVNKSKDDNISSPYENAFDVLLEDEVVQDEIVEHQPLEGDQKLKPNDDNNNINDNNNNNNNDNNNINNNNNNNMIKTKTKKKKKKNKGKKSKLNDEQDEKSVNDYKDNDDDLFNEFRSDICAKDGCKISVRLHGFVCQFCKLKYCVGHMNGVFHGCTKELRTNHQQTLRKAFSGKKQLKPTQLNNLKMKLQDKISSETKNRVKSSNTKSKKKKSSRSAALAKLRKS